jgi:hypothetical protein
VVRFPQIWQTVDSALNSAEHFAPLLDDIPADRLARQSTLAEHYLT